MGDLCISREITDVASRSHQVGHAISDYYMLDEHVYQIKHEAHCNAVHNTSVIVDSFGFRSPLGDIFTRLLTLTTCISRQLIRFIEDLVCRDADGYLQKLVVSSSGPHSRSSSHSICKYVESFSSSSKYCIADTSPGIRGRTLEVREELLVNKRCEVIKTGYSHQSFSFIVQGLMLPLFGLKLAWRLALASWRFSFNYIRCAEVQVRSITSRVRKTLRGSSDDIGWLQHTPGMAPVEDGTARFLELLEKIRNGEHMLPNSYVYLLIPVEHNAWELKQYIEELYWGSGKRVMLLGHSKGGVDAAAALSMYWCDLEDKVAGLALVQSPYGGTPIASDILREGQVADKETRRIMELLICKLIKGDIRALEDLTYDKRREFIIKHKLPKQIPLISFHSEASVAPGVLATMTHIAEAELPWLAIPKFRSEGSDDVAQAGHQLPVVIPLSAAMAVCALHLQLRYGEKSDGLVTCRDAEVPGSIVVRPDRKLDHAWMVYSSQRKDPSEPDSCEMCEALLTMLVELGKIKRESDVHCMGHGAS